MLLTARRYLRRFFLISVYTLGVLGIVASGGGGGGIGGGSDWESGVFLPADTFRARCEDPRSGIDPFTGMPFSDIQGSTTDENEFLRAYSNNTYLWYDEIIDRNPDDYDNPLVYFDLMKTTAITPSGRARDRFHFTIPSDEWFQVSQSGVSPGYGATFVILSSLPPREVVVAYTEPGSPATLANLVRGERILEIDGVDVINDDSQTGVDTINAGLFPALAGKTHTFLIRESSGATRSESITSANITSTPVQNVGPLPPPNNDVGYLLFNDHIAASEQALIDAINQLNAAGIVDLVLDLRYNGGGFLDIASELAYMIAGPATAGRIFETLEFNNKHPTTNPVTGQPLSPVPFHTTTQGFSTPAGQALPTLNLPRVFVLTGSGTCSASESIINSLRGVGVQVFLFGSTTCGKPYGFYATDNCSTTYFTIQFRGVNAMGFGDYADGYSPLNTVGNPGELLPGCSVADDFSQPLGDPMEARLTAALDFRDFGSCPAASGRPATATEGIVLKNPWLKNRILR
jgi:hypothetical protein